MGRPKKPTTLKALEGTLRADRQIENEMMPSLLLDVPKPPTYLTRPARSEWLSVCKELLDLGMLHRVDLALLSAYCQEMGNYINANKELKDGGYVLTIDRQDGSEYSMPSPWVAIKNKSLDNALKIASQFGFTPSARTKISTTGGKDDDGFDAMLMMDREDE